MSELDPYGAIDWSEQPKVRFAWQFNLLDTYRMWKAIGMLNYYLDQDEDEEVLEYDHPLMKLQYEIQDRLDELIAEGLRNGWVVSPLLHIKQILADDG